MEGESKGPMSGKNKEKASGEVGFFVRTKEGGIERMMNEPPDDAEKQNRELAAKLLATDKAKEQARRVANAKRLAREASMYTPGGEKEQEMSEPFVPGPGDEQVFQRSDFQPKPEKKPGLFERIGSFFKGK
jgi:hypothetical protein